ncbi:hypothetical protein [Polaribacter sp.]|uniref:hypothetical protein n=1 Tax=Polaribacter sp. TaxID=1920175 RepID=UPI003F6B7CE2
MITTPIRAEGALSDVSGLIKDIAIEVRNAEFLLASERIDIFFEINKFKENLFCHIEYPYVDYQYRDAFYYYHSSKNSHTEKDCIRISFFNFKYNYDNPYDELSKTNGYLGFLVVRPTNRNSFGRMNLSPEVFNLPPLELLLMTINATVRGVRLETKVFPTSGQDGELHSCSETSLLSVSKYFAKYSEFKSENASYIENEVNKLRFEQTPPGNGLKQNEISYILKKAGFGVRNYFRSKNNASVFKLAFNDYVESGIPVIVVLSKTIPQSIFFNKDNLQGKIKNRTQSPAVSHSLVCIGHKDSTLDEFKIKTQKVPSGDYKDKMIINYIDSIKKQRSYVYIDDEYAPYRLGNFENPIKDYANNEDSEEYYISGFVVPLASRIRMDSVRIRRIYKEHIVSDKKLLLTKGIIEYGKYPLINRYLITTSKAIKNFYCTDSKIGKEFKLIIDSLHLPRFIWLIECIDVDKSFDKQVVGFVILDPNTPIFPNTILFQYFDGKCQINTIEEMRYNEQKEVGKQHLKRYSQNLNTI